MNTETKIVYADDVEAAKLQMVIDRKRGRESSAIVKALAAARPGSRSDRNGTMGSET